MRTPLQLRVDQITEACRSEAERAREAAVGSILRADAIARDFAQRDAAIQALKESLTMLSGRWRRPCWCCGSLGMCEHREPELAERWDTGKIS